MNQRIILFCGVFVITGLGIGTALWLRSTAAASNVSGQGAVNATISNETTYLIAPKNEDGTINYIEALDSIGSKGLTQDNNAAIVLFEVFGPNTIEAPSQRAFVKCLNVHPQRFISVEAFATARPKGTTDSGVRETIDVVNRAVQQICAGEGCPADSVPDLLAWLKANDDQLDKLLAGSRRQQFYVPFGEDANGLLLGRPPGADEIRLAIQALVCRAWVRCGSGQDSAFDADLMASLRWARLFGQEPGIASVIVAWSAEENGLNACINLARSGKLSQARTLTLLAALDNLPDKATTKAKMEADRYMQLHVVATLQREGKARLLRELNVPVVDAGLPINADFNVVMKAINRENDDLAVIVGLPTYPARMTALQARKDKLVMERPSRIHEFAGDGGWWKNLASKSVEQQRADLSPRLGEYLASYLAPNLGQTFLKEAELDVKLGQTRVTLALRNYHESHGDYPVMLSDLINDQFRSVPLDGFIMEPFKYRRDGRGYVLYSIGRNIHDDEGNGDDIMISTSN